MWSKHGTLPYPVVRVLSTSCSRMEKRGSSITASPVPLAVTIPASPTLTASNYRGLRMTGRILVTGPAGFIGFHLSRRFGDMDDQVKMVVYLC